MKRRRKGSLSFIILDILEKTIDGYVRLEDFANKHYLYAYRGRWDQSLPKSALAQAVKRLKEQGLIEQVKVNDQTILKLTFAGNELMEGECFDDAKWDKIWRIVIFDIPEQKRIIRDLFRRNLKKWGFKHLQKSVWISKKDFYHKLVDYIKDLGIEKWVIVFETSKLSIDNNIFNDRGS